MHLAELVTLVALSVLAATYAVVVSLLDRRRAREIEADLTQDAHASRKRRRR